MRIVEYAPLIGFNWTFVMVLVSFAVLYLIVKKFFFEKVRGFMEAREQKVVDQFESAEAAERLAQERLGEYSGKLDGVEIERRAILKEAKRRADERAQAVISEAEGQAAELLRQARKEIERERAEAAVAMREQIAMLAVYAAETIIERGLDEEGHLALVDDVIVNHGAGTWIH